MAIMANSEALKKTIKSTRSCARFKSNYTTYLATSGYFYFMLARRLAKIGGVFL